MPNTTRTVVLTAALTLTSLVAAQESPRTWRLDFYATGGQGIEAYSADRLVVEPLPWPTIARTTSNSDLP
jgi:hypothetical protein